MRDIFSLPAKQKLNLLMKNRNFIFSAKNEHRNFQKQLNQKRCPIRFLNVFGKKSNFESKKLLKQKIALLRQILINNLIKSGPLFNVYTLHSTYTPLH